MRTYKQELQHLYKSEFIRSFAEIDPDTGEYKRDIRDADRKILYLCDGGGCSACCGGNNEFCNHTTDVTHAKNFEYDGHNGYCEQPTINPKELEPLINKIVEVLPDLVNACIEHLPEYIEANRPPTDHDLTSCGHGNACPYYPDGCGKCTYNNP